MAKLEKTVFIKAPVEKVFAFMDDPMHLPEIWPSMVEVKDVTPLTGGKYSFAWVYKMAGVKMDGLSEVTEWVANQHIVTESRKGIQSRFDWVYSAEAGGTKLKVEVEYTIPIPLLGKLAESIIVKQNEHESDVLLANLKARMEA